MEDLLLSKYFPPGFRFHPSDEELSMYYLKRKVLGKSLSPKMIAEVDVYKFAPWDLPAMAWLKTKDLIWYFFCPRARKYPNGAKANRATEFGYWKSTGNDRTVTYASRPVGKIKTLIFHRGKAPDGERTNWVMHEYRLEDQMLTDRGVSQDSYVICKIYEKSGLGPRNGENYGARFVEEEWESDTEDDNLQERVSAPVLHDMDCGVVGGSVSVLTSGTPNIISPVGAPIVAAANVDSPSSSTACNTQNCNTTTALAGTTTPVTALPGTSTLATVLPDTATLATASPSTATPTTVEPLSVPGYDDLDMMLSCFSNEDIGDIYNDLGDLADFFAPNIEWGDCFIELNDLPRVD